MIRRNRGSALSGNRQKQGKVVCAELMRYVHLYIPSKLCFTLLCEKDVVL